MEAPWVRSETLSQACWHRFWPYAPGVGSPCIGAGREEVLLALALDAAIEAARARVQIATATGYYRRAPDCNAFDGSSAGRLVGIYAQRSQRRAVAAVMETMGPLGMRLRQ